MKSLLLISTLASSLLLANSALADHKHHNKHHHKHSHHKHYVVEHTEYARVVSSRPIYRTVAVEVPMDSCQVQTVAYSERQGGNSLQGAIVGGVIGAAIGHEVGRSGHATAAGGVIGAAIGNEVGSGSRQVTRYEDREVCSTRYRTEYERQLVGYDVAYHYDDRMYYTETRHHPGARIVHVRGHH
jgi:uncharacterized protein YcfJ